MRRHRLILLYIGFTFLQTAFAQKTETTVSSSACPYVKIEPERLPALNIPRSGHTVFFVNGEVTVVGGHTSGFVLTPTAEYLKDGKWHLLHTVYAHDGGFCVVLRSGKVLLAGGFKDNLGIGHSYEVEMYNPASHSFEGFGCLDQKRASATAVELDDGRVLITGNWYTDDGMEVFDGQASFSHLKEVGQNRFLPHLFRTSDNDVLVVSGYDSYNQPIKTPLVESMKGKALHVPLFDNWHPLHFDLPLQSYDSFIGDEEKGIFAYLMPVQDHEGHMAIAEVHDTEPQALTNAFSLLPTACPVPMTYRGDSILYYTPVIVDRQHQRGYVMGADRTGRQYALCIDYAKKPAPLTLFHTGKLTDTLALTTPVMTDEGNLVLTGIKSIGKFNFSPSASTLLLRLAEPATPEDGTYATLSLWQWLCLAIALAIVMPTCAYLFIYKSRQQKKAAATEPTAPEAEANEQQLMRRIVKLMEEERLYMNSDLKTSDIAQRLGVHRNYVSSCINSIQGCTFTQFINGYRIEYAKQLMRQHPKKKRAAIFEKAGFANETTFYRTFKAVTGMSPTEWMDKND